MDIQDQIAIMQHYANGGKVEAQQMVNDPKWVQLSESGAVFNWAYFNYRIKKEPMKFTLWMNSPHHTNPVVVRDEDHMRRIEATYINNKFITVTEDV